MNKDEKKKKTRVYLLVSMFFIAIPTIVKIIILLVGQNTEGLNINVWEDLYNGSLYLYAISLLSPIWYVIDTVFADEKPKEQRHLIPVTKTFVTMCVILILYVITYIFGVSAIKINSAVSGIISVIALIGSVYLAYEIRINDVEEIEKPDEVRKEDEDQLERKMESAEKGVAVKAEKKGIEGTLEIDFEEED